MPNIDSQILSDRARAELAAKISQTGEGVNTDYVSLTTGVKPDGYVADTGLEIGSYPVADGVVQRVKWNSGTSQWDDFGSAYATIGGVKVSSVADLKEGGVDERTINLLGYYTKGDGGGGVLYWDSTRSTSTHNGGTIINPNHNSVVGSESWYNASGDGTSITETGCWVRETVSQNINVFWFGARANSSFDDSIAIQAAIDSFNNEGGVLYFPSGRSYRIDNTITVDKSYLTLKGTSTPFLKGARFLINTDIKVFQIDAAGVVFEDLYVLVDTITGSGATAQVNHTTAAIEIGDTSTNRDEIIIRNCVFRGCYEAIRDWTNNTRIENNLFSSCYQGVRLKSTVSHDNRNRSIIGNVFHSGVQSSTDTDDVWAIYVESGCNHDIINSNRIDGSFFQGGICLLGSETTVVGNDFRFNRGQADIMLGGSGNTVTGNVLTDSYGHGIKIIGNKNVVSSNTIKRTQLHGIFFDLSDSDALSNVNLNRVIGNYIEDCGLDVEAVYDGINVSGTKSSIVYNNIRNCKRYGIRIESGKQVLGGNILESNTTADLSNASGSVPLFTALDDYSDNLPELPAHKIKEYITPRDDDGLKIGVSTTSKLSFYGVTPLVQPTALTASDTSTVDGTYGSEEQNVINNLRTRINELETKLQGLGLIA